ncbi:helix-turn-helix transcriptional regulator [Schauerella aestuarii]|uniref:helix-turn-helix transcriptional regulator n=1 Tax=Schauerella aestuarii TaxID=2511204 RepID=UPI001370B56B|nr:helix-turn-helix transcriptional regulator [Achromobacter aestuarii]MYZ41620.1 XRE family transcriptional regulator [Achromobacter aestuarii]
MAFDPSLLARPTHATPGNFPASGRHATRAGDPVRDARNVDPGTGRFRADNELGLFLRQRRESLDPVLLGFSRGGRRRTPGLRREEVAQLADVGVTWYTWLEQGRDIQVSAKVMGAIATALHCTEAETRHVFTLAGLGEQVPVQERLCKSVSSMCQTILDTLNPHPAMVQNARYDIIGFNHAYARLTGVDLQMLAVEDRNCIYLALTHAGWQACLIDFEESLSRMVASFRAAMADHRDDPAWQAQLQRYFDVSEVFRTTWDRYEVRGIENQVKRFKHPELGVLAFQQTNFWTAPRGGDRMMVYMPADDDTAQRLREGG